MGQLVFAHGDPVSPINNDVGRLEHRVTQETIGGQILGVQLLLLLLVGGVAFQPRERGDHPQEQVQFGVFFDVGLDEHDGLFGVQSCGEPIQDHVPCVLADRSGIRIVRGQSVPVRNEEETVVLILKLDPVLERPVKVPQVKPPRGTHTAQDPLVLVHQVFLLLSSSQIHPPGSPPPKTPQGPRPKAKFSQRDLPRAEARIPTSP